MRVELFFDTTTVFNYQISSCWTTDATFNEVTKLVSINSLIHLLQVPGVCQNTEWMVREHFSDGSKVLGYGNNGMYFDIASVDLANSNLIITKQITGKTAASGSIILLLMLLIFFN